MTDTSKAVHSNNFLERLVRVDQGEWPRLVIAFCYFFFLLGGYFMLRPIRGTVAANNSEILHWLYTGTFLTMLAIVPVFGFLVSAFGGDSSSLRFTCFFLFNLVLFIIGFTDDDTPLWMQRTFYIWLSVFNLFVVSIFWSFMADIFRPGQAQRLFGFIMAGGSLGAMAGSWITTVLVLTLGSRNMMMAAAVCLLIATVLAVILGPLHQKAERDRPTAVIGGSIWEGAVHVFRSEYLLYACLLMLLHNLTSTFLYNGLAVLVNEQIVGFDERTHFFGIIDLVVQVIAFVFQFLVTSRMVTSLGMSRTLVMVPMMLAGGFVILGSAMGLVLFAALQVPNVQ